MDWDLGRPDFTEHDKSNFGFYAEQNTVVVRKFGNRNGNGNGNNIHDDDASQVHLERKRRRNTSFSSSPLTTRD